MWTFLARGGGIILLPQVPTSGCFSIQGPKSVRGPEQGSVTLQCHYDAEWENYRKWWCRGANWGSCNILIRTNQSSKAGKRGRVSIRDYPEKLSFAVTMENLRRDDADTYWCGIERVGTDLGYQVKVTVDPAPMNPRDSPPPGRRAMPTNNSRAWGTPFIRTHYVLLIFVKFPILLILLGAILWLKESQRVRPSMQTCPQQKRQPRVFRWQGLRPGALELHPGLGVPPRHPPCSAQLWGTAEDLSEVSLPPGIRAPHSHVFR
ncbi:CMRF35-like molecule 7 isoform X2 [Choloepus didactylus]|uniref:CMRF35-like molecule 7 isoform X2 n=1 Tax=Choloepus didactylus TaxID=27675 RepID=UPI00189EFBDE|nr:CMRF35-like molecule 7 isoform X2 [Choloepus didactylus]